MLPDACQESVEVGAGETSGRRSGGGVVVLLEGEDLGGEFIEVFEVVEGEELALDDGEVGLVPTWLSQAAWTGRWTIWAFR